MYGPFYDLNFTSVLLVPEPQALMIFYAVGLDLVSINSPFIAYSELVAKFSSAQDTKKSTVCVKINQILFKILMKSLEGFIVVACQSP